MGEEHRDSGVDIQLGPVAGPLGREPEGGRNWEGGSPDPVLSGLAAAGTVKGIQAAGVMATTKHYILNEQEHFRQGPPPDYLEEALSSNLDDVSRTGLLHIDKANGHSIMRLRALVSLDSSGTVLTG